MQSRSSFLLIENPAAGRKKHKLVRATVEALVAGGARIQSQLTAYPGHAEKIARSAASSTDIDAVIAAGGDGSIREVAKGLLGTPMPLGVIPSGTGNVLAFELGMRRTPAALATYLLTGKARAIVPSLANDEPFLLMAGIGFDAAVVSAVNGVAKRRFGKAAFAGPALRTLFSPVHPALHATMDGEALDAGWVIATHVSRYAGQMRLTRSTGILDGRLELIAVEQSSRLRFASRLGLLALGRLVGATGVTARICSRIQIDSDNPVAVQIDGDAFGTTPLVIRPGNLALQLIVPPGFIH